MQKRNLKVYLYEDGEVTYEYGSGIRIYEYNLHTKLVLNESYLFKHEVVDPSELSISPIQRLFNHDSMDEGLYRLKILEIFNSYNKSSCDIKYDEDCILVERDDKFFDDFHICQCHSYDEKYRFDYNTAVTPIDYIKVENKKLGYNAYLIFTPGIKDKLPKSTLEYILKEKRGYMFNVVEETDSLRRIMNLNPEISSKQTFITCFEEIDKDMYYNIEEDNNACFHSIVRIDNLEFKLLAKNKINLEYIKPCLYDIAANFYNSDMHTLEFITEQRLKELGIKVIYVTCSFVEI